MVGCELSIVLPCLNEAETLSTCIKKAQAYLERAGVVGEILVADNGSCDGSQSIARDLGVRVVDVQDRGYGAALLGGIAAAKGRYIIMGDADDSYDFANLDAFVERLREGYDMVMGNRFKGGIQPGAMPHLHRYLGNPVLTGIGRLFFRSPCGDFHCGLRGFSKAAVEQLDLRTTGMEFASEMVVKSTLHRQRITEVPTTLRKDGRSRPPHLRSWRDGWRHLRFLLLYSPRWLFLYPGFMLVALGLMAMALLVAGPVTVGTVVFDVHTLMVASTMILLGVQAMAFAVLSKQFGINQRLLAEDRQFSALLEKIPLEKAVAGAVALIAVGFAGILLALAIWESRGFGQLDYAQTMRIVIPGLTAVSSGIEIMMAAFFLSVLNLPVRKR
ncbi:MAG: glycosyltransferase family 2 protein [Chloroflexota bacterium]